MLDGGEASGTFSSDDFRQGEPSESSGNAVSNNRHDRDNEANLEGIRLVNLGLVNSTAAAAADPSASNSTIQHQQKPPGALQYQPIHGTSEEASVRQFPLLTAKRSLTSFLDYLSPGQIAGEVVAVALEVALTWGLSHLFHGPVEPADWLQAEQQQEQQQLEPVSVFRRWARRFVAGPPVALRRVFGEDSSSDRKTTLDSLVAKSFLGASLYRDALGFAAIPLVPSWVGCLVTPMCVRFNFVVSDLQKNMTWADIGSIALANGIRALAYSSAALICDGVMHLAEQRRKLRRQKRLEKMLNNNNTNNGQQQQQQGGGGGGGLAPRTMTESSYIDYETFLPKNLFSGVCSYTVWTHIFSALSTTAWAVVGDALGFGAIMILRRIVRPTAFRAMVAVTAARMLCQAGTLTAFRLYAARFCALVSTTPVAVIAKSVAATAAAGASPAAKPTTTTSTSSITTTKASDASSSAAVVVTPSQSSTNSPNRQMPNQPQAGRVSPAAVPFRPSPATPQTAALFPPANASAATTPQSSEKQQQKQQKQQAKDTESSEERKKASESSEKPQKPLNVTPLRSLVHTRLGHQHRHVPLVGSSGNVAALATSSSSKKEQEQLPLPARPPLTSPLTLTPAATPAGQGNPRGGAFPDVPVSALSSTTASVGAAPNACSSVTPTSMITPPAAASTNSVKATPPSNSSTNNNNNNFQPSAELERRRRLLDLDRAFGGCSALCLSHLSEAVHSMLSSLQPDNNVRLHALLFLAAVDEYVSAVNHGELQRPMRAIAQKRGQRIFSSSASASSSSVPRSGNSSVSGTVGGGGASVPATPAGSLPPPGSPAFSTAGFTPLTPAAGGFNNAVPVDASASSTFNSTTVPGSPGATFGGSASTSSQQQQQHQLPPQVQLIPEYGYNIYDHTSYVRFKRYTFTAQDIQERKQLRAQTGVAPLFCVACKKTFKENHAAVILPCEHPVHDVCARRLKSDWCPRCSRPFERPAVSNSSIYDFHVAQSRLAAVLGLWSQHILLPPFLWFTEWRRVRRYVVRKAEQGRGARAMQIAELEQQKKNQQQASSSSSSVDASLSAVVSALSSAAVAETWYEALVESQIIFSVPDDFAPSAYGLVDVPIMAALASLGLLAYNRAHERTLAMIHESLVDGTNGISSSTSNSRILPIAKIRC